MAQGCVKEREQKIGFSLKGDRLGPMERVYCNIVPLPT